MDLNVFLTQQAANNGKATPAHSKGAAGVFAEGTEGLSFMDLIFARLTAEGQTGQGNPDGEEGTTIETALNVQTTEESLVADEALLEDISDEDIVSAIGEVSNDTELEGQIAAITEKVIEKITAMLERRLQGVPEENKGEGLSLGQLKHELREELAGIQTDPEGTPILIATGITPQELTDIINDIKDGNENGESFSINIVQVLPPQSKREVVFLPRGAVTTQAKHPAGELTAPTNGVDADTDASRLNALTVGDEVATGEDSALFEEDDFEGLMRMLEKAQAKSGKEGMSNGAKGIEKAINNIKQQVSAGLSTVTGTPPALTELFTNFASDSIYPDGYDFALGGTNSLSLTGTAQLTSIVSHVQQAGMTHPATQTVATAIAKATTSAESRNITIQLDPPDLGRVSIQMEFSKEKNTVKAIVTAEKPETHLMLQRDAQTLERALQEAGLDADGSSLEFQLSQDGNMFEQDQHSTGGHSGGGSDSADGEEETIEVIETTMDWYVDPDTGVMRYDALV